jgi:hypothetical protein
MTDHSEFVFDTKHDRYPVAVHVFRTDTHGRILLMHRAGSGFADSQLDLPARQHRPRGDPRRVRGTRATDRFDEPVTDALGYVPDSTVVHNADIGRAQRRSPKGSACRPE